MQSVVQIRVRGVLYSALVRRRSLGESIKLRKREERVIVHLSFRDDIAEYLEGQPVLCEQFLRGDVVKV